MPYKDRDQALAAARRRYAEKRLDPEWRAKHNRRARDNYGPRRRDYMREYARKRYGHEPRPTVDPRSAQAQHYARQRARRAADLARARENERTKNQRRRARLRDSASSGVTPAQWTAILAAHDGRCFYCGAGGRLTRDHVKPIARGGRDEPSNVVPACKSCNSSKSDRDLFLFVARKVRL